MPSTPVRRRLFRWLAAALLALVGLWAGPPGATARAEPGPYRIGPGDALVVRVDGEPQLSARFVVDPAGNLQLPMVGGLAVVGLTAAEVAERLVTKLAADFLVDPRVGVDVVEYGSQPVQVMGAVRQPGTYYLRGETGVLAILSLAGGVLADKSNSEVQLIRPGDAVRSLSIEKLLSGEEPDVALRAGDRVNVAEGKVFYVNGEVARPGQIPWKEGVTVTRAMALAGGASKTANLRKAYVLRDGRKIAVDIQKVMKGDQEDVLLFPGDQLYIEESVL